jgi:hypothetical protein
MYINKINLHRGHLSLHPFQLEVSQLLITHFDMHNEEQSI